MHLFFFFRFGFFHNDARLGFRGRDEAIFADIAPVHVIYIKCGIQLDRVSPPIGPNPFSVQQTVFQWILGVDPLCGRSTLIFFRYMGSRKDDTHGHINHIYTSIGRDKQQPAFSVRLVRDSIILQYRRHLQILRID